MWFYRSRNVRAAILCTSMQKISQHVQSQVFFAIFYVFYIHINTQIYINTHKYLHNTHKHTNAPWAHGQGPGPGPNMVCVSVCVCVFVCLCVLCEYLCVFMYICVFICRNIHNFHKICTFFETYACFMKYLKRTANQTRVFYIQIIKYIKQKFENRHVGLFFSQMCIESRRGHSQTDKIRCL